MDWREVKQEILDQIDENCRFVPLLKTWLPDDKVTDELINRGYYCREGITNPEEDFCINISI